MPRVRTRENGVILAFLVLTLVVLVATHDLADPPTWVTGTVVIGLGVIAPTLVNEYLDRPAGDD